MCFCLQGIRDGSPLRVPSCLRACLYACVCFKCKRTLSFDYRSKARQWPSLQQHKTCSLESSMCLPLAPTEGGHFMTLGTGHFQAQGMRLVGPGWTAGVLTKGHFFLCKSCISSFAAAPRCQGLGGACCWERGRGGPGDISPTPPPQWAEPG